MTPRNTKFKIDSPRTNDRSKKYFEKHLDKIIIEGLSKIEFN